MIFNLISYGTNFLLLIHQNDHDRIHLLVWLIIAGLLVTMPLALSWKSRTSRFVLFMSRSKAVDVRIQAALGLPEWARTRGWWTGDSDERVGLVKILLIGELRWRVEWRDEGGRRTEVSDSPNCIKLASLPQHYPFYIYYYFSPKVHGQLDERLRNV